MAIAGRSFLPGPHTVPPDLEGHPTVRMVLQWLADSACALAHASSALVRVDAPGWLAPGSVSVVSAGPDHSGKPRPDAQSSPRAGAAALLLTIPIRAHGTTLGDLVLSGRSEGGFTPEEEEFARALAIVAGAAAWGARLCQESRQRQRWLESTFALTAQLVSERELAAGHEFDVVAHHALEAAASALALVAVPENGSFRTVAAAGTMLSRRLLDGVALRLHQPRGYAEAGPADQWLGLQGASGLGAVLVARLGRSMAGGGVLLLARREDEVFSSSDVSAAAEFGAAAGIALGLRSTAGGSGAEAVSADRRRIAEQLQQVVAPRILAAEVDVRELGSLGLAPKAAVRAEEVAREMDTALQSLQRAAHYVGARRESLEGGGRESSAFSGALLKALDGEAAQAGTEMTIAGPAAEVPAAAEEPLVALVNDVFGAVRERSPWLQVNLTVAVQEAEAVLIVEDRTRPGPGCPARGATALSQLAARIPNASLDAVSSGTRLVCTVPFVPHAS